MLKRPEPKTFDVLLAEQLTPNMRRVSIGGTALQDFPQGQDGGYLKLMLPGADPSERPSVRTYTIHRQRPDALDIDFALHGTEALAVRPSPGRRPPSRVNASQLAVPARRSLCLPASTGISSLAT